MNKTYRESKKNKKAYIKDELYRKEVLNINFYDALKRLKHSKNVNLVLTSEYHLTRRWFAYGNNWYIERNKRIKSF